MFTHPAKLLEKEFKAKLDDLVNQLLANEFSIDNAGKFISSIKLFLSNESVRSFVQEFFIEKLRSLSLILKVSDEKLFSSFRLIIKTLIKVNDEKLNEALATYFAKDKNPVLFLIFLEELVKEKKSTICCEQLFFSLISIHEYDRVNIHKFITVLNKDYHYFIDNMINHHMNESLVLWVESISIHEEDLLKEIIPIIISKHQNLKISDDTLFKLAAVILANNISYVKELIPILDFERFTKYIIYSIYSGTRLKVMKNYCNYLFNFNNNQFIDFENIF